jgi:23S rRNA (adenine2503-C2)-methyltransferase
MERYGIKADMHEQKISIFSMTAQEYADAISMRLGKGRQHAMRLYGDWFRRGRVEGDASWIEPQARALVKKMIESTDFSLPIPSSTRGEGSLVKFLLRFSDGLESESVLIPMRFGSTLCLSSQVGCRMGCAFCETGRMGLLRHLTTQEIVSQVFYAKFILRAAVRNLVFMGMGEPLDNFEAVMQAIRVLTCPEGFGMGQSRITVSTSGHVDNLYRMMESDLGVRLAVSVNAPNDSKRARLMPVNKKWDMQKLKEALLTYCTHTGKEILIEYVLLSDVNDGLEDACDLATYLEGIACRINLIPYNSQSKERFAPPTAERMEAFVCVLRQRGYPVLLRGTKGTGIMAACGQLGNLEMRKKMH